LSTSVYFQLFFWSVLLEQLLRIGWKNYPGGRINRVQGEWRTVEVLADCTVAVVRTDRRAPKAERGLLAEARGLENAVGSYLHHGADCRGGDAGKLRNLVFWGGKSQGGKLFCRLIRSRPAATNPFVFA
jgi:hypothetical protein